MCFVSSIYFFSFLTFLSFFSALALATVKKEETVGSRFRQLLSLAHEYWLVGVDFCMTEYCEMDPKQGMVT